MSLKSILGLAGALFGGGNAATIDRDTLKAGLAAGTVALIDVREPDEFAAGHIKGAVNLPGSAFDAAALPNDGRTLVLMCQAGPRAFSAQMRAAAAGRPGALVYRGSMSDWVRAGEPVVRAGRR